MHGHGAARTITETVVIPAMPATPVRPNRGQVEPMSAQGSQVPWSTTVCRLRFQGRPTLNHLAPTGPAAPHKSPSI
jgi:hypothetical protein